MKWHFLVWWNLIHVSSEAVYHFNWSGFLLIRFLGHFQPHQGKPELWELDSDQHHNVGIRGSNFLDENARYNFHLFVLWYLMIYLQVKLTRYPILWIGRMKWLNWLGILLPGHVQKISTFSSQSCFFSQSLLKFPIVVEDIAPVKFLSLFSWFFYARTWFFPLSCTFALHK